MKIRRTIALGDVATIERSTVQPEQIETGTMYVGLEHIENGGVFVGVRPVEAGIIESSKFQFTAAVRRRGSPVGPWKSDRYSSSSEWRQLAQPSRLPR
jgi:hypothetical protein